MERQPEAPFELIPDAMDTGHDGSIERERDREHQAQVLESLGELAGGIARDFNNLLAVIVNYAAFVAEDLAVAEKAAESAEVGDGWEAMRDDLEQIRVAAEQAACLSHRLLDCARCDSARPDARRDQMLSARE